MNEPAAQPRPLKVAWITSFPVEWLPEAPDFVRKLPRTHPATWQRVLLEEFTKVGSQKLGVRSASNASSELEIHILIVRRVFERNFEFKLNGVTFHCLKLPPGMRSLSLYWWETFLIRHRLKQIQPDLVHAWGTERGAALVASRLGYPYLVTMQGLLQWYCEHVRMNRHHRFDARLERPSLRRAKVVTTESSFAVKWLRDHYPRLEVRQAEHAPNWLFHRLQRRPETSPIQFLYVGVLSQIKGTDLLFTALEKLAPELDFRLTVVGAPWPEFSSEINDSIFPKLWKRIQFRQDLTQAQVGDELARCTMLLFPTRVDTSPNAVKEAVVAGVPVVATAVGGIVDYLFPGKNGFTFPAGDLEAFISAIRAAVAHPLFGEGKVDDATLQQMREYLSPAVMRENFLAAYARVLDLAKK